MILARTLALFVPLGLAVGLWLWRSPGPRERAAVVVSCCWNGMALLLLQAAGHGWWTWSAELEGGLLFGMPAEAWIGWTALWGAAPLLSSNPLAVLAAALFLDLHAMPLLSPILTLHPDWLVGEAVAVGVALLPGVVLAHWTRTGTRTGWRAAGQAIWWWTSIAILLPLLLGAGPTNPAWQLLLLPVGWFAASVQAFVEDGEGTPIPLDPTRRLVSTGPYAYVRNPLQVTSALGFGILGAATGEPLLAAGAVVVVVYSVGFATWHEDRVLSVTLEGWQDYRRAVPAWRPRWRPVPGPRATLYVAEGCDLCSDLAAKIEALGPVGLDFAPASSHPDVLTRVRWERPGCPPADGIVAVCRALEQVNLGWASVAVFGRLPIVRSVLQLVFDAFGGAPRVERA